MKTSIVLFLLGLLIFKIPLNTRHILNNVDDCLMYYFHIYSYDKAYNMEGNGYEDSYIQKSSRVRREGDTVYLVDGKIDYFFYDELIRKKTRKIVISSRGGNHFAQEEISRFVFKNKIEVVVPPGAECFSACAMIFLYSQKRYLGVGTKLMLHTPRVGKCLVESRILYLGKNNIITQVREFNRLKSGLFISFNKMYSKFTSFYGPSLAHRWLREMGKDLKAPLNGNLLGFGDWYITPYEAKKLGLVKEVMEESHPAIANLNLDGFPIKR